MSMATFKAVSKMKPEGLAVESESRGFRVVMDEPENLGGTNTGMNPVEALLCALGSCQTIVAVAFAKANHVNLQDFKVEVEGDLDTGGFLHGKPGVRMGFSEVRVKMYFKTDSPPDKVEAFQKFIESRCPVGDVVLNGTKVVSMPAVIEN